MINWTPATTTTEDLRATFTNYPGTEDARRALEEYQRRCEGKAR